MRIKTSRNRLSQKPAHARMMKRNLVTSLLLYETIRTTKNRARAIQPLVDRLISTAKKKDAYLAIRSLNQFVTDKNASRKVMEVFVKRYAARTSGMTRMIPVGARKGDGAELVDLVLIGDADVAPATPKKASKSSASSRS